MEVKGHEMNTNVKGRMEESKCPMAAYHMDILVEMGEGSRQESRDLHVFPFLLTLALFIALGWDIVSCELCNSKLTSNPTSTYLQSHSDSIPRDDNQKCPLTMVLTSQ